ncbi:MAG TPA: superoxide dismutase, Ni [Candidatus Saccharimonadales bacterium]|nr:superoxide dismutase, Ni [Candidatus Saccharimonadales bacterium]
MKLVNFIKPVYAHCDIPCGIYETDTMRHAADTCLRMLDKIDELGEGKGEKTSEHNNFIRMVMVKEKHAELCKEQIYILWSDYFKPEHLKKTPDLHEKMWLAAKQCSKVKQTLSREEAQKLIAMVHDIAHIFEGTKK